MVGKQRSEEQVPAGLPLTIWILGIVSLLTNSSSVIITALTPLFVTSILGGTSVDIGYIRGFTEALSYIVKLFSGVLSDYIGKRKALVLGGYACAAFTKPLFAVAHDIWVYATAQTLERIANGIRDTPRDALIADCAPKGKKGVCFGIRQSCAGAGSALGAFLCYQIMQMTGSNIRMTYFLATIPIFIAITLLYFGAEEPKNLSRLKDRKKRGFPIRRAELALLGRRYWVFISVVLVFMLVRFSESFLVLKAQTLGLEAKHASLVLLVVYLFNTPAARIVGKMSDKVDRRLFLLFGFSVMLTSCVVLACADSIPITMIGAALYGIHHGATQGTFYAMIADYSPSKLKGTAFGVFNLTCAVGMLISNAVVGHLWHWYAPVVAFLFPSAVVLLAIVGLLFVKNPSAEEEGSEESVL
ncbi:MAG: MFS transporter [Holosporales bacterium]|jgi:MFS family permease|nr:MFS transporter [Holosporales bacterium]